MSHTGKFARVELTDLLDPDSSIWERAPISRFVEVSGIARGVEEAQGKAEFYRAWLQALDKSPKFVPMYGIREIPPSEPFDLREYIRLELLNIFSWPKDKGYPPKKLFSDYETLLSALKVSSQTDQPVLMQALLRRYGNLDDRLPELQVINVQFGPYDIKKVKPLLKERFL